MCTLFNLVCSASAEHRSFRSGRGSLRARCDERFLRGRIQRVGHQVTNSQPLLLGVNQPEQRFLDANCRFADAVRFASISVIYLGGVLSLRGLGSTDFGFEQTLYVSFSSSFFWALEALNCPAIRRQVALIAP
jgi:hypothetical protein